MPSRASATRYARALFDVALKESDPKQVDRDLSAFAALMASHADLHGVLTNPGVPATGKRGIADALAARLNAVDPVRKLLRLLADRDRLSLVPDLVAVYQERLRAHEHIVRAEVTTAAPLSPDEATRLGDRLARATGQRVEITTRVDPAMIGGIVARIGSTVYDGSVATQLSNLRQRLMQSN